MQLIVCARFVVRRGKARFPSGRQSHPAVFVPAGSNRSGRGGNEAAEAFGAEGHVGDPASTQTAAEANAVQASKRLMWKPTRPQNGEGRDCWGSGRRVHPAISTGVVAAGCVRRGIVATREALWGERRRWPFNGGSARIGSGLMGWRMGPYDRRSRCNAGGGKGPWFKVNARSGEGRRRLDQ